jgi:rhodanese-related sulfurtransferase
MKRFLIQTALIVLISFMCALLYNYILGEPLPLLKKYDPINSYDPLPLSEQPIIDEINVEMLKSLKDQGQIILVDARIEMEYRIKHIPDAVNLPISDFDRVYPKQSPLFRQDKIIVTYCSDDSCTDSLLLARLLFKKGHENVFVFRGGIQQWVELGLGVKAEIRGLNQDED